MCRAGVKQGDVGAPKVWVLQPLASGRRVGLSARTDTWTGFPRVGEWRKREGVAQVPARPTRSPVPVIKTKIGG